MGGLDGTPTRGEAFRWAVGALRSAGVESAAGDAEVLLAEAAGLARGEALRERGACLDPVSAERFRWLVGRRCGREPVSRILGWREFFGLPFLVTEAVLDPRPDTETLVEAALELLSGVPDGPRVLDMGTGSGAVAVAVAACRQDASVTALDLSPSALAVARANADLNGVGARVRLLQGDLRAVPLPDGSFDLVVSNPPYVGEDEYAALPPEVRLGDPYLALVGGPRGTELYPALAGEAARLLGPGGALAVEVGASQGPEVSAVLAAAGFAGVEPRMDLSGRARVVLGRLRG